MNPDQLMTSTYRDLMQREHAAGAWGGGGAKHADEVLHFATETGSESVLDYGCGTGKLRDELLGMGFLDVREFDPGIAGKNDTPAAADMVCCTDVLEHVEPDFVDNTLSHIATLARRAVYLSIALRPASKILLDGSNAHKTVRPDRWWTTHIGLRMPFPHKRFETRDNLFVWLWR